MATLLHFVKCLGKNIQLPNQNRNISLSATTHLKEIIEKKEGNTLIVEAVIKPDKNNERLLKSKNGACLICSSGLDIKHTDVLILSQFLRKDGCILPRRITGLCKMQQKRISTLILMSQRAGLMPNTSSPNIYANPSKRTKWLKFNTYFDESTIKSRIYVPKTY
ncbi:mitochondrial ribosomal protein S18A [Ptiloglossa arizonensis]|uniref:mitochondrial ribosomal protein S18A n=1 Tax=Ptiloglossa arizonensis TaxID=3350558 RepID=UPI003FA04599